MKVEKVNSVELATQTKSSERRADTQNTTPSQPVALEDRVTLSQEALRSPDDKNVQNVDTEIPTRVTKKPMPDPRYTAQAILDRELLGLKKFYS